MMGDILSQDFFTNIEMHHVLLQEQINSGLKVPNVASEHLAQAHHY